MRSCRHIWWSPSAASTKVLLVCLKHKTATKKLKMFFPLIPSHASSLKFLTQSTVHCSQLKGGSSFLKGWFTTMIKYFHHTVGSTLILSLGERASLFCQRLNKIWRTVCCKHWKKHLSHFKPYIFCNLPCLAFPISFYNMLWQLDRFKALAVSDRAFLCKMKITISNRLNIFTHAEI